MDAERGNCHQRQGADFRVGNDPADRSHAFLLTPATPGDANLDGQVDINDLAIVLTNFGQTGMTWAQASSPGTARWTSTT